MPPRERDYSTENQFLLAGMVAGCLSTRLPVELEVGGDGNYTGRVIVYRPSGPWAVTVSPAPEVPDAAV